MCPMEALWGGRSLLHNAASGTILGYVGVSAGQVIYESSICQQ